MPSGRAQGRRHTLAEADPDHPFGPSKSSRRLCLLRLHDERIFRLLRDLPPPLNSLALHHNTFVGPAPPLVDLEPSIRSPAAALLPWLFWETFGDLDDETFLTIAEAAGCHLLASIVLDHLIDSQAADPASSALLYKGLIDRGVSLLTELFHSESGFWQHFHRLAREHLVGLATELAGRADPRQLSHEVAVRMAQAKVSPGILTLAAMTEAAGARGWLESIEKSIRHVGVASQLIDDARDWRTDAEARHITYFLTCLAPTEAWASATWPSTDELESRIQTEWLDTDHYRKAIVEIDRAIEQVHDIYCPRWTNYVHEKRIQTDRLLKATLAGHLIRQLNGDAGTAAGDVAPSSSVRSTPQSESKTTRPHALHEACQLALEAILAAQRFDGSWIDFDLPAVGASDTWVTAHVGLQLATMPQAWSDFVGTQRLEAATSYLRSKWRHGWGYNDLAPVDADSTSHALLFFHATRSEPPGSTIKALQAFQQPDGGFATYLRSGGEPIPESWCRSHPDVTPVAIEALSAHSRDRQHLDLIRQALRRFEEDRKGIDQWPVFWWNLNWYTTSAWSRTLQVLGQSCPQPLWPENMGLSLDCDSDLDAALLLELAVYAGRTGEARQMVERLLANQLDNGFWPPRPVLRQPKAGVERPWEVEDFGESYADVFGVYSAATILNRLARYEGIRQAD